MHSTGARMLQRFQGRFLWGAWLGLRRGVGGVKSERIQEPGKEGQFLEPRAINHGFARGADGLVSIVGPKWGKLGAWKRRSSLIRRAVAGAAAGGEHSSAASTRATGQIA